VKLLPAIIYAGLVGFPTLHGAPPGASEVNTLAKEDQEKYENMTWSERSWVPRLWPKDKVEALRKSYWDYGKKYGGIYWDIAEENLVLLGDEEAIDLCASEGRIGAFSWNRNPKVLPKLVPLLLSDETQGSGPQSHPVAIEAISAIFNLIETTPEFSAGVRDWADEGSHSIYSQLPIGIAIVRKWWWLNKPFFDAGDYGNVKIGDPFPPDPSNPNTDATTEPASTAAPFPATPSNSASVSPAMPGAVAPMSDTPMWALLGGASAIAGLGAIVWRFRQTGKK
jgi:hypothetical protein